MSKNMQQAKLDREIEELENAMKAGTTEVKETPTPPTEDKSEDVDPSTSEEVELSEPADDTQKPKQYTNWKKRYTELRSHHDSLVYELRSELASIKGRNVELNSKNQGLSEALSKNTVNVSTLTDEERDVLGVDAITALEKMTNQAVGPLKEQLAEERTRRTKMEEEDAKRAKAAVVTDFLGRLGSLVPDYASIDVDPKFGEWMEQQDPMSGYARKVLFKRAEANGDVGRVAEFFNVFKKETGVKTNPLDRHVTPSGTNASVQTQPTSEDKRVISWAYVNKFYDDAARGKYKNNMSAFRKEEAIIDRATMEGRVK